jgi:hypothetical protein
LRRLINQIKQKRARNHTRQANLPQLVIINLRKGNYQ